MPHTLYTDISNPISIGHLRGQLQETNRRYQRPSRKLNPRPFGVTVHDANHYTVRELRFRLYCLMYVQGHIIKRFKLLARILTKLKLFYDEITQLNTQEQCFYLV